MGKFNVKLDATLWAVGKVDRTEAFAWYVKGWGAIPGTQIPADWSSEFHSARVGVHSQQGVSYTAGQMELAVTPKDGLRSAYGTTVTGGKFAVVPFSGWFGTSAVSGVTSLVEDEVPFLSGLQQSFTSLPEQKPGYQAQFISETDFGLVEVLVNSARIDPKTGQIVSGTLGAYVSPIEQGVYLGPGVATDGNLLSPQFSVEVPPVDLSLMTFAHGYYSEDSSGFKNATAPLRQAARAWEWPIAQHMLRRVFARPETPRPDLMLPVEPPTRQAP